MTFLVNQRRVFLGAGRGGGSVPCLPPDSTNAAAAAAAIVAAP